MNRKCFSQPQSKGSPKQRQTALGLKLVYSFINFIIPLPATYLKLPKPAKTYGETNTEIC